MWIWIVLGVVVLAAIGAIVSYNRFISQKNLVKDAWANIDTELRRRYDLIPNLVETVRGYATHEREVFENVTKARAMATAATGSPGRAGRRGGSARRRPSPALRGRRELPRPEGQPELPRAAGRALQHRGPPADRASLLQRQRPRLQPPREAVPLGADREHVRLQGSGVLRGRGGDPRGRRAAGELHASPGPRSRSRAAADPSRRSAPPADPSPADPPGADRPPERPDE